MSKPRIKNITPFDAIYARDIEFVWTGDMAYKNRLIIYDNNTLDIIYDRIITSFYLRHTIPANTLLNGKKYLAQVQVFNKDGVASALSDKVIFSVLSTPKFSFTNVTKDQVVTNSSLMVMIDYNQSNNDPLDSCRFYLYDHLGQELLESERFTSLGESLTYVYKGLENYQKYFIQCIGVTYSGMQIETGKISISVKYENPSKYAKLYATNHSDKGYISYESNIKIIECDQDKEDYTFENSFIDLIGKYITYSKDFVVEKDFTMMIKGRELYQTATIFTARNGTYEFVISSRIYDDGKIRFKLEVKNAQSSYVLYTDALTLSPDNLVTIWIRRVNNVYQIIPIIDYEYSTQTNMWFGQSMPSKPDKSDYWIDTLNSVTQRVDKNDVIVHIDDTAPENPKLFAVWVGGK